MDDAFPDWVAALELLEADLLDYEALLEDPAAAPPAEWTAPEALGPLPAVLLPRAHAVLEQQQRLRERLGAALHANTRQRGLAARITGATTAPSVPSYLDVTA